MAKQPSTVEPDASSQPQDDSKKCGIIMPISATASHDQEHWAKVLTVVKRAVDASEFDALPVWQGDAIDRITVRIIGNIFSCDIVICDVTDHNPNVMFELGLRLSSKKPTLIIAEEGTKIPFDIGDYRAIFYPGDLNIFGVESFLSELSLCIQEKFNAYKDGSYRAFLHDIGPIDVLEPQTQPAPLESILIDRVDGLARRIDQLTVSIPWPSQNALAPRNPMNRPKSSTLSGRPNFRIEPAENTNVKELVSALSEISKASSWRYIRDGDGTIAIHADASGLANATDLRNEIAAKLRERGVQFRNVWSVS